MNLRRTSRVCLFVCVCACAAPSISRVPSEEDSKPQIEVLFEDKETNPEQIWSSCRLTLDGSSPILPVSYDVRGPWVNYTILCAEEVRTSCYKSSLKIYVQGGGAIFRAQAYDSPEESHMKIRFGLINERGSKLPQYLYFHFECLTSGY
jgi:hypothetical protein